MIKMTVAEMVKNAEIAAVNKASAFVIHNGCRLYPEVFNNIEDVKKYVSENYKEDWLAFVNVYVDEYGGVFDATII